MSALSGTAYLRTSHLSVQRDQTRCSNRLARFGDGCKASVLNHARRDVTVHIVPQVLGYARAGSPVMGVALLDASSAKAQIFFKQVQDFRRNVPYVY